MKPLQKGDFGDTVKQWQLFLQSAGYKIPYADGAFGPATEKETLKFQLKNNLKPDGIVVPKTWNFVTSVSNNTPLSEKWPKQNYTSMVNFYGPVGENQTKLELPYKVKLAWDTKVSLSKITCQKEIIKLRLDVFGGCLNVRKMRGGSAWSIHSWGAAVDLDPDNNQLRWGKEKATFGKEVYVPFWKIVESEGWTSLGRERNYDWMHFQAASL